MEFEVRPHEAALNAPMKIRPRIRGIFFVTMKYTVVDVYLHMATK